MAATIRNDLAKIEAVNMPIKIGNFSRTLLDISGSACRFLNQSLAARVVNISSNAIWVGKTIKSQLRFLSN